MKPASDALKAYLAAAINLIYVDLITIELVTGVKLRYTSGDQPIVVNGHLFTASDVLILTGARLTSSIGLESNEADITLLPSGDSQVGGIPFLNAVQYGLFNRAKFTQERLYMPTWGDTSLGTIVTYVGQINEVTPSSGQVDIKCYDLSYILNVYMPSRQYQPTCSWVFGDANCGFDKTSLAVNGTVTGSASGSYVLCGLTEQAGYFNSGTIKFTSGLNAGFTRSVKGYSPGIVTLVAPLPNPASIGDAFTITPGCSRNFEGATAVFTGSVSTGSTPGSLFNDNQAAPGTYNGYYIQAQSGVNAGQIAQISSWQPGICTTVSNFTNQPNPGDVYYIGTYAPPFPGFPYVFRPIAGFTVVNPTSAAVIPTNLTNADGYFNGGFVLFTSGANINQQAVISSYVSGILTLASALPNVPATGDEFQASTTDSFNQGTCVGYFGDDAKLHFGGQPFVPVPETAF